MNASPETVYCTLPVPDITPEEAMRAHKLYAKHHRAFHRDLLLRYHYGFAAKVALRYTTPEFPIDEALSAACRGLLEALKRYKPRKGTFTTFSYWWMLKYITLERSFAKHIVPLPGGLVRKNRKLRQLQNSGHSEVVISRLLKLSAKEVEQLKTLHAEPSGCPLNWVDVDSIPDEQPTPVECLQSKDTNFEVESLRAALATLTEREQVIVLGRFCTPPKSLKLLGVEVGLSDESVRKIFSEAMRKLKASVAQQKETNGESVD
jgi:RNA polymerase sigma factor (sigma-70 family)